MQVLLVSACGTGLSLPFCHPSGVEGGQLPLVVPAAPGDISLPGGQIEGNNGPKRSTCI